MSWNPLDNPQDFVFIDGKKTPGIAEVVGGNSPRKWDERQGYGLSGATLVFTGNQLSEFEIKLKLVTPQDWEDWLIFKSTVDRTPNGKRPLALTVVHPWLQDLGIISAVVLDVSQPSQEDDGIWIVSIKMKQFRKVKLQLAKPDAAAPTQPEDPVDKQIVALANQLQTEALAK